MNIAEFLATATSCDSDFHNPITKSNSIGKKCLLHLRGPADPLAAGFPALTHCHRQHPGGQQLGKGIEVVSTEQHADVPSACVAAGMFTMEQTLLQRKTKPTVPRQSVRHISLPSLAACSCLRAPSSFWATECHCHS